MATLSKSVSGETLEHFKELDAYDWDEDAEFQTGLASILGSSSASCHTQELTLRARCFYYSRKHNISLDSNVYKQWHQENSSTLGNPRVETSISLNTSRQSDQASQHAGDIPSDPAAPYPISFAHIVELITSGRPIPGIKHIPDTILEGEKSEGMTHRRRKPWEKD